jgi:hypothetical protein
VASIEKGRALIALYERREDAEAARAELVAHEFSPDRVHLTAYDEVGRGDDGAVLGEDDDVGQRIGDFFRSLFEGGAVIEDRSEQIARLVRAGKVAITVQPRQEEEIPEIEAILERHGPLNIDRAEAARGTRPRLEPSQRG